VAQSAWRDRRDRLLRARVISRRVCGFCATSLWIKRTGRQQGATGIVDQTKGTAA
jgi:hypothetical protein